MKVIVEYDLPEDEYKYECSLAATRMKLAFSTILENLRAREKYNDRLSEDAIAELQYCRQLIGETLDENDLWNLFNRL